MDQSAHKWKFVDAEHHPETHSHLPKGRKLRSDLMNEQASNCVIALATALIDTMRQVSPQWNRAYMRLEADADDMSARISYVDPVGVHLLGGIDHSAVYRQAIDLGIQLKALTDTGRRPFRVCLVVVDGAFNYEVLFEYEDSGKWAISKLDGGSGVPVGLHEEKLARALPSRSSRRPPWHKFWS